MWVREVAKSHDGRIDLIMIESENPIIVHVKRRKTSSRTKSIKEIRDLLGDILLSGSSNFIFVSIVDIFRKIQLIVTMLQFKIIVELFGSYDHRCSFHIL